MVCSWGVYRYIWTYLKKKDKMSKICIVMKSLCVMVEAEETNGTLELLFWPPKDSQDLQDLAWVEHSIINHESDNRSAAYIALRQILRMDWWLGSILHLWPRNMRKNAKLIWLGMSIQFLTTNLTNRANLAWVEHSILTTEYTEITEVLGLWVQALRHCLIT